MQQIKDMAPLVSIEGALAHDIDVSELDGDPDHGVSRIPRFGLDFDLVPARRRIARFPFFGRKKRKAGGGRA